MKGFLIALLLCSLSASAVEQGATRDAVIAELGTPRGSMNANGEEILLFAEGTVTLQNGKVIRTDLSQKYVKEAAERAAKAKLLRAQKEAELQHQKALFPEDSVTTVPCAYTETEDWSYLPETIEPIRQTYAYDVYLPQNYYEIERRRFPCLILEAPALWHSIKEEVRSEKWITVVLHNGGEQQTGRTVNGSFLAAFDDAVHRFKISKDRIFILGRVPAAIFASMRPVAGIILQEPDFEGLASLDDSIDFLRKNRDLRVYVLLGNRSEANVKAQANFIAAHIPKYHIQIYEGISATPAPPDAEAAIDWMKKEYGMR